MPISSPIEPDDGGDATPSWSLAIHGGAGVFERDMDPKRRARVVSALESALEAGRTRLAAGDSAVDVVEAVVRQLEDAPEFNAGKGAVFNAEGGHELDAAIMDGRTLDAGAVAGVTTLRNPISLARAVMEKSKHVFLIGRGAEAFAAELGFETVAQDYFFVDARHRQWLEAQEREAEERDARAPADGKDLSTVGAVARDREGHLAAATSTGGLTNKRFGRVGDVPVIGAGTFADDRSAAISCTGWGEKFIRRAVAHDVSARVAYGGRTLETAVREVIDEELDSGDGGLIAVGADGSIVLAFNTSGMYRGAADANGRFEVGIWDTMEPSNR
ncbi:MAG: isoaspartyl peptidase/L-asparaginase [Acidobacteriota bacterium]